MRILLLGHSLIEFGDWGRLLPGHTAVNLGRAGETTSGLLGRLDRAVRDNPDADAVAVMSGTNDLLAGDDAFLHEYRSVARRLRRAYPRAPILLHGLLPISADWIEPGAIAAANEGIARIGAETGVSYIDLTGRFVDRAGRLRTELYDADGVHLSGEGYRVWAAALEELLTKGSSKTD
jgi:lysophospholipase L1-like esterase